MALTVPAETTMLMSSGPTTAEPPTANAPRRNWGELVLWVILGSGGFHLAYVAHPGVFILIYLFAMLRLVQTANGRAAYYAGLAVGLLIAIGRLTFFWSIFSAGAAGLWYVYAFWLGLFVTIAGACLRRLGPRAWWLIPCLWTGLEYFRSELYYLRFSWLNVGYAFAGVPGQAPLHCLGMYGTGFLLTAVASLAAAWWPKRRLLALAALAVGAAAVSLPGLGRLPARPPPSTQVRVTGIQMECPAEQEVLVRLTQAVRQYPETDLFVLSEYTFLNPIPAKIKNWCRQHRRYLIVGGEDPAPAGSFYNTSYVVGPDGEIAFRQVKCVPIQFFKDGLPAPDQRVWDSPWGKIGIGICYDLSYRRVTDRLVDLGAEALIVPTMDVMDWGRRQHELHARVAPVRAAEYGLPLFRLASSGISQSVGRDGQVRVTAPCPGDGVMLHDTLELRGPGHVPWDGGLAPACVGITAGVLGWLGLVTLREKRRRRSAQPCQP